MFSVHPSVHSMFDTPLDISLSGLEPRWSRVAFPPKPNNYIRSSHLSQNACSPAFAVRAVTVSCLVAHKSGRFESSAQFVSDECGCVRLAEHCSLGGSYTGVHPMGLFTHMTQSPGQRPGVRLLPRDVDAPITYTLTAYEGLVAAGSGHRQCAPQLRLYRHLLHPDVQRDEVVTGRLRGAYFYPRDASPRSLPAVLDLFGTGGGLIQHRGALLASHGFAAFSLAYFDYNGAPDLDELCLEYFQEAIDWLNSRPQVLGNGVGVVGVSLGANLAVLCAIHLKNIRCAIPINGLAQSSGSFPVELRGQVLPTQDGGDLGLLQREIYPDDEAERSKPLIYRAFMETVPHEPHTVYPIELAPAHMHFLFLLSECDMNSPTVRAARELKKRWDAAGRDEDQFLRQEYRGAGHLLEPTYIPHTYASYHKTFDRLVAWGGDPYSQARAQQHSWSLIRQFFARHLGQPQPVDDLNTAIKAKL